MSFWRGKKVLVTGGAGFVGSHLVEELLRREPWADVTVADSFTRGRRKNLDAVLDKINLVKIDFMTLANARKACGGQDIVINLAAHVRGVGYNTAHHGTMFRDNMLMSAHILEAARLAKVERFVVVSSACIYPLNPTIPTPESEGARGEPDDASRGYGWAKRMGEFMARSYSKEFGMKIAIARPYNAYGPRDYFKGDSHVISALIARVLGGEDPVRVWGDGSATRSFLYVDDFTRGLLDLCERHCECDPVNIGSDEEVTIKRLAQMIVKLSGSKARLLFDSAKPSGQPRRLGDTRKAKALMKFRTKVSLKEGLKRTIRWYRENYPCVL